MPSPPHAPRYPLLSLKFARFYVDFAGKGFRFCLPSLKNGFVKLHGRPLFAATVKTPGTGRPSRIPQLHLPRNTPAPFCSLFSDHSIIPPRVSHFRTPKALFSVPFCFRNRSISLPALTGCTYLHLFFWFRYRAVPRPLRVRQRAQQLSGAPVMKKGFELRMPFGVRYDFHHDTVSEKPNKK